MDEQIDKIKEILEANNKAEAYYKTTPGNRNSPMKVESKRLDIKATTTQLNNLFEQKVREIFEDIDNKLFPVTGFPNVLGIYMNVWKALKDRKEGGDGEQRTGIYFRTLGR